MLVRNVKHFETCRNHCKRDHPFVKQNRKASNYQKERSGKGIFSRYQEDDELYQVD